jgi:hypothetical protein
MCQPPLKRLIGVILGLCVHKEQVVTSKPEVLTIGPPGHPGESGARWSQYIFPCQDNAACPSILWLGKQHETTFLSSGNDTSTEKCGQLVTVWDPPMFLHLRGPAFPPGHPLASQGSGQPSVKESLPSQLSEPEG